MKTLIFVSVLALCGAAGAIDVLPDFDASTFAASCKARPDKKPILACYGDRYTLLHGLIGSNRLLVETHAQAPGVDPVGYANAAAKYTANVESAKLFNAPFAPLLRAELKKSPAALALLPKLLAAVDVSMSGQEVESGESLIFYRARLARNHAAALSLLKEVEFSR